MGSFPAEIDGALLALMAVQALAVAIIRTVQELVHKETTESGPHHGRDHVGTQLVKGCGRPTKGLEDQTWSQLTSRIQRCARDGSNSGDNQGYHASDNGRIEEPLGLFVVF